MFIVANWNDKYSITISEKAGDVEYLAWELSEIVFYWFMFFRTLTASHVKCYQSIAVN